MENVLENGGGDFWANDSEFQTLSEEASAQEIESFEKDQEIQAEVEEAEHQAIETAPLRHLKKKRRKIKAI